MSRTLTRPMFRNGGMAQREKYMGGGIKTIRPKYMGGGMTGIMSGIRPDAGLTPRVGYKDGPSLEEIIAGKELQQSGKTIFTEDYIKNEYDKYRKASKETMCVYYYKKDYWVLLSKSPKRPSNITSLRFPLPIDG